MKKKFAAIISLMVIMGMLPVAVVSLSGKSVSIGASTPDSANDKEKTVCACAAVMCESGFCDEALRAALIIAETNLAAGFDEDINYSDKELYNRIVGIYDSEKEKYISFDGKPVYIPHSSCSNGVTVKNEKYTYLSPVASPWDCECRNYSADISCEGASMYGINRLCEKGFSAEDALGYYLPGSKIMLTKQ